MGYEDLLSQYQLSDEERKNLLLGNLLLGISGGLMSNRGRGNIFGAAGSGIVQGAQLGQNAIADARRGKLDEFKMRMVGQEYDQKQQAAQAAAAQQAAAEKALGGIFGSGAPQLDKMGPGGPTPANAALVAPAPTVDKYRQAAAFYAAKGNAAAAKTFSEIADKMEEEYSTTPQPVRDASGNIRLAQFGKRGGNKVAEGLTPAEKLHFSDTGGTAGVGQDPYSGLPVFAGLPKTMTPGETASNKLGWANYGLSKAASDRAAAAVANPPPAFHEGQYVYPPTAPGGARAVPVPGYQQPQQAGIKQAIAQNNVTLGNIERALSLVDERPQSLGFQNKLGDDFAQRADPAGVEVRAAIANIGSQKIHDRSGAAVSLSEAPRLQPFVPAVTDTAETVAKKLRLLRAEANKMQEELNGGASMETVTGGRGATGGWSIKEVK